MLNICWAVARGTSALFSGKFRHCILPGALLHIVTKSRLKWADGWADLKIVGFIKEGLY